MAFRVLREDDRAFYVEGHGGEVRVAKSGLSPSKVTAWQRMCSGGEVKKARKMAGGGEVVPEEEYAPEAKNLGALRFMHTVPFGPQLAAGAQALGARVRGETSDFDKSYEYHRQRNEAALKALAAKESSPAWSAASVLPYVATGPTAGAVYAGTAAASRGGSPAEVALETASNLLPTHGMSGPVTVPAQLAYHGTPRAWSGKHFDLSQIGAGEGKGQPELIGEYGWGGYLAKGADVGDRYRARVTADQLPEPVRDADFLVLSGMTRRMEAGQSLRDAYYQTASALARKTKPNTKAWQELNASLDRYQPDASGLEPRLYELDAPDDVDLMHYNRSIGEQPEGVRRALEGLGFTNPKQSAREAYADLAAQAGSAAGASARLREAGIPGHLFETGTGHTNMVIYDPKRAPVVREARSIEELRSMPPPKMAEGGEVKPYRLLKETSDSFTVDDGTGPFKIAKSGLGEALCATIRGYADGGEVAPSVTGDPALDELLARPEPATAPVPPVAPADVTLTGSPAVDEQIASADLSGPPAPAMASILGPEWVRQFEAKMGRAPAREDFVPEPWQGLPISRPGTAGALDAGPDGEGEGATSAVAQEAPAASAPTLLAVPTAATAASGVAPSFTVPDVRRELAAGRAEQAAGLRAQADAAAAEGQRQAEILAAAEERRAADAAEYQKRLGALQEKGDALYQSILDKKIDPRRLWNESSAPRKIAASIGMILGGIGAGITRGPNYAVEIIDRAIQRDIDAQRAEVDKGQNLLAHNLRQTDDLRLAHQLTRADLLDSTAAQIQRAAASFTGEKAQAAATSAIGNLRAEAAKERQAVAATSQQMTAQARMLPLQVEQARMQIDATKRAAALQGLQMQTLTQVLEGVGSQIDPRALMLLPDDMRDRVVLMPGGRAAMALTKEDAGNVRGAMEAVAEINGAISDMREFRKRHSGGTIAPGSLSAATSTATAIRNKMVRAMGKGLGVLNASDYELLFGMIPDPAAFFTTDNAVNAKIDVLQQSSNDKLGAAIRTRLIGYQDQPRVRVRSN